jgi:serine/threonine protein phosphatase PrpC
MVSLRIGAGAHRGLVREENQDRISRIPSPFGELFIVADGMGGHEGGATAAQMLIDGLGEHLRALPPETPPDEALRLAGQRAHDEIYRRAQNDRSLAQMGATGVLALIQGNQAWIAHAGDSRAYLWRGGQLRRLTRDHTLVQRMVDRQMLDEEEARHHPDANVVTRAFGQAPEVEIEVAAPLELRAGDRLLLCSDGLSGYVEDSAIAQVLAADGDTQAATNALIDLALRAGGEDNVSVQLLAVQEEKAPAVAPRPAGSETRPTVAVAERAPRRGISGFLLLLPLLLVAVLAGALLPWRSWLAGEPEESEETAPPPATSDLTDRTDPTDSTDPYGAAGTLPLGTDFDAPALPEQAPAAASQVPRLTVLSPAGARAPAVKQRVLRAYPGNWSAPVSLDARLSGALVPGRVYFRPGFAPAAAELARELGSSAAPWPEGLAGEHPEADLLVIYPSRPAPGVTP